MERIIRHKYLTWSRYEYPIEFPSSSFSFTILEVADVTNPNSSYKRNQIITYEKSIFSTSVFNVNSNGIRTKY
jgi:hypothetical protein